MHLVLECRRHDIKWRLTEAPHAQCRSAQLSEQARHANLHLGWSLILNDSNAAYHCTAAVLPLLYDLHAPQS